MDAQTRMEALRFLHNGMQHSKFAPTRELITRLTSLLGSREAAQEALEEAERIGLIVPEGLIPNPAPPDKTWRLSGTFDRTRLDVPA